MQKKNVVILHHYLIKVYILVSVKTQDKRKTVNIMELDA